MFTSCHHLLLGGKLILSVLELEHEKYDPELKATTKIDRLKSFHI
jgi:hypothetical protein